MILGSATRRRKPMLTAIVTKHVEDPGNRPHNQHRVFLATLPASETSGFTRIRLLWRNPGGILT
jgi:hypothetical protein